MSSVSSDWPTALTLLCTVAAVAAARWYLHRRATAEAEQPLNDDVPALNVHWAAPPAPHADGEEEAPRAEVEVEAPRADVEEAGTPLQPAAPDWLRGDVDDLVACVESMQVETASWRNEFEGKVERMEEEVANLKTRQ